MPIEIIIGDITQQSVDAIVNSASPSMYADHGVSGAIHRAAGDALRHECQRIGHVDAGNAVLTAGYNLKAPHVIHAVAPQWFGGENQEAEFLEATYQSVFEIVETEHFKSIAIPALGAGSYNWPPEQAAAIAIKATNAFLKIHPHVLVRFVCYDAAIGTAYNQTLIQ